jgi:peptidoglycan hydrolase-like protein with peptidoglycan-binding domain
MYCMMRRYWRLPVALLGLLALREACLNNVPIVDAATSGSNYQMSSSDFIKSLQRELKRAGYDPGVTDGKMGPATRNALRRFQAANDLSPTGAPDIPTLTKLLSQGLPK